MRLIAVVLALSLPSVANALPDGVKLGMAAFELRLSNWNQLNPYTLRLYQPNSPLGTARAIAHPDVGVCYLEEATGLSDLDSLEEAEKFQRDYRAIFSELSLRHGTPKESFTHRQYLDPIRTIRIFELAKRELGKFWAFPTLHHWRESNGNGVRMEFRYEIDGSRQSIGLAVVRYRSSEAMLCNDLLRVEARTSIAELVRDDSLSLWSRWYRWIRVGLFGVARLDDLR